jgi:hypothetical protein
MKAFSRSTIDTSIEKQIATAFVASTQFLSRVSSLFEPEYIINDYIRTICKWSLNYFEEYGEAPGPTIQSIFEIEKHTLDKAEVELIQTTLSKLSKEFVSDGGLNEEYIYDNTINYFDRRDLSLRIEKASLLKDAGRHKEAKEVLQAKPAIEKALANWVDIFDPEFVEKVFSDDKKGIFQMPGRLGDLLGSFRRGWLVGILGGFKKGKSNSLLEIGVAALVTKLKVAYISLEMSEEEVAERFYRRITGFGDGEELAYPIFDCLHNQMGTCSKIERRNKTTIRTMIKEQIR